MEPVRDPEGIEIDYLQRSGAIEGRDVLEIGCGDGRLTWRYANLAEAVTGVDPDFERLSEMAATRPETVKRRIPFVQAAAEKLPFADEAFDTTLFSWSL
jgi:ubiquinone/menaquinone biosynthesis C-methylase UbiE